MRLIEQYRQEIAGWDWEGLKADALKDGTDLENECARVFLGNVFGLSPSGKYYQPWAHSNVEVCKSCAEALDGPCDDQTPCIAPIDYEGDKATYHCEVCKDAAFNAALDAVAEAHGMWIESGEGDPCDIFAVISVGGESEDNEQEGE